MYYNISFAWFFTMDVTFSFTEVALSIPDGHWESNWSEAGQVWTMGSC